MIFLYGINFTRKMGNSQSKQLDEENGFIIIPEHEITSTKGRLFTELVEYSKTALSIASCATIKTAGFIGTALVRFGELTSSA